MLTAIVFSFVFLVITSTLYLSVMLT